MTTNVDSLDRIIRVVIGAALFWFASTSVSPYAWLGHIGILPLLTAAVGSCALYSVLGVRTCTLKQS
jgi:Protein of unknown function (DUF2892)